MTNEQFNELMNALRVLGREMLKINNALDLLVGEKRAQFRMTPNGTPICAKHGIEMRLRQKQGDAWHSHAVQVNGQTLWCRGYPFPGATPADGWNVPGIGA